MSSFSFFCSHFFFSPSLLVEVSIDQWMRIKRTAGDNYWSRNQRKRVLWNHSWRVRESLPNVRTQGVRPWKALSTLTFEWPHSKTICQYLSARISMKVSLTKFLFFVTLAETRNGKLGKAKNGQTQRNPNNLFYRIFSKPVNSCMHLVTLALRVKYSKRQTKWK